MTKTERTEIAAALDGSAGLLLELVEAAGAMTSAATAFVASLQKIRSEAAAKSTALRQMAAQIRNAN